MQALDPLAAGVALSAEMLRLNRSMRKLTKGTKHARHGISDLSKEMDLFADLYDELFRVYIFDSNTTSFTKSPVKRLVAWTEETIDTLRDVLDRIQDLVDISRDSVVDVWAARMKWHAIEREMEFMRISLGMARQGIKGFTNIKVFEKLEEEEDMLRMAIERGDRQCLEERFGMTLEDRLRTVKHMRNNCRKQRHTIENRIKETRSELLEQHDKKSRGSGIVREPRRLFCFTRSVAKYVDNVLPAKESGRRRRSRSKLDSVSQVSGSPASPTPATLERTARSTSRVSRPHMLAETPSVPENRTRTSSGCTLCSGTCVHVEEYGKKNKTHVKLMTPPGLTEGLGRADEVGQRDLLAVPETNQDAASDNRKHHHGSVSSSKPSSSHNLRVSLGPKSTGTEIKSDLHEATSSIASEDFETWWHTRGVPEPDAFTALEQKARLVKRNDAYDDVSSEDEVEAESTHWRAGYDRSVSPEDVFTQLQVPFSQAH